MKLEVAELESGLDKNKAVVSSFWGKLLEASINEYKNEEYLKAGSNLTNLDNKEFDWLLDLAASLPEEYRKDVADREGYRMATHVCEETQREILDKIQEVIDRDNDGSLSMHELSDVYTKKRYKARKRVFKLFIDMDTDMNKLENWIRCLTPLFLTYSTHNSKALRVLSSKFSATKTSIAAPICKGIYDRVCQLLMSEEFWKGTHHMSIGLNTGEAILATYAYNCDVYTRMIMESSILLNREVLIHDEEIDKLVRLKSIFTITGGSVPAGERYYRSPKMYKEFARKYNYSKKQTSQDLDYVTALFGENGLTNKEPVGVKRGYDPSDSLIMHKTEAFANAADFVMSEDYERYIDTVKEASIDMIPPLEVDLDLLKRFFTIMYPFDTDTTLSRTVDGIDPESHIRLLEHIVFWAPFIVRMRTLCSGKDSEKLKEYLEKNHKEYAEYYNRPFYLLKVLMEKWMNEEKAMGLELEEAVKKIEEARKRAEVEKLEAMKEKEKQAVNARRKELEDEGFTMVSDTSKYERWLNGDTVRIFFKTSKQDEKKEVLSGLEDLGLTSSKIRNIKNPAGVIRYIKIQDTVIYTDTLIESAIHKAARYGLEGPIYNMNIVSTIFDLAYDKVFFELDWLDKAVLRAMSNTVPVQDVRYCTKVMRDRGIIGQIKGKKNGPKIFALTPEGYCLCRIQKEYTCLPVISIPWEKYIGEKLSDVLGSGNYIDIITTPVRDIDKMITGKSPKFLDKYYVTSI